MNPQPKRAGRTKFSNDDMLFCGFVIGMFTCAILFTCIQDWTLIALAVGLGIGIVGGWLGHVGYRWFVG